MVDRLFIGSSPDASTGAQTPALSPERLERFARHIVIPEIGGAGQVALADKHVAVIGLGGIGSPALQYLAASGIGTFTLVDDAYNANPESMRAALQALQARPAGKRLIALGEMLEIGAGSELAHAGLAEPVLATGAEKVFLAGAGMAALESSLSGRIETESERRAPDLLEKVKNSLTDGSILLIKGSNASGMGVLADALREWGAVESATVMGAHAERDGRV